MVRLVCKLGMQLQMRQYDCNGAAGRKFSAAVVVKYLGRYAMSAGRSLVLTMGVSFDCVCGFL